MVRLRAAVHYVRDGLARHVADGGEHVPADGRRQVDVDHACGRHEEDVLVGPVRHYVGATAERLDGVAGGVGRGAPGCRRERREFRAGASMRLWRGPSPAGRVQRRGSPSWFTELLGPDLWNWFSELFSWCGSTRPSKARHLISTHDHTLFTYFRYLGFKRAVSNC